VVGAFELTPGQRAEEVEEDPDEEFIASITGKTQRQSSNFFVVAEYTSMHYEKTPASQY